MRFYLEYINHLGRLQKKSAHGRLQAGFTITEVLLAGVMMLIAVLVSGIGVINLLRSNYRANADSEIRNNLNRTLEFVSDDVRRARTIVRTERDINTDEVPQARAAGSRPVLAFQIPNPQNPGQALPNQIVYYTTDPRNPLTGPRVLWRFGPDLDVNGNYITPADINTWIPSPVTDMLAATANNPNCPADFQLIAADPKAVDGFFACVRPDGGQVILNANARVNLTTGNTDKDKVDYAVSTRVSTRATNNRPFDLVPPPAPFETGLATTIPVLTAAANVEAVLIQGVCTSSCTVATGPQVDDLKQPLTITDAPTTIQGNPGDSVVVTISTTLDNSSWNPKNNESVEAYTSTSTNSPKTLDNNQVLLVFTDSSAKSYQVLLTITPR